MNTARLKDIADKRGNVKLLDGKLVSIIGSRNPSDEGIKEALSATREAIKKGYGVVSGGAKGIDTVVHKETLRLNGNAICVLALPFSNLYPKENEGLFNEISKKGLLLTITKENEPTGKHLFPERNRVMARISNFTLICDAGIKSGTTHQATECLKLNKSVYFSYTIINKKYDWVSDHLNNGAGIFYGKL